MRQKTRKAKTFSDRELSLILIATTVIVIAAIAIIIFSVPVVYDIKEFDMSLTVSNYTEFSKDTGIVNFGAVEPGEISIKNLMVYNEKEIPAKVNIVAKGELAKFVTASKNNFELAPNSAKSFLVFANVPADAEFKKYSGTLTIKVIYSPSFSITGKLTGLATAKVSVNVLEVNRLVATVYEAGTITGIENATVSVLNGSTEVTSGTTNSSGMAVFSDLDAGNYTVQASKTGYDTNSTTAEVVAGGTTNVTITIQETEVAVSLPEAGAPRREEILPTLLKPAITFVDYPDAITVPAGSSTTFVVIVENSGNTQLSNLVLLIEGFPASGAFDIIPAMIEKFRIRQRASFIVSVYVPEKIPSGTYVTALKVQTDEITLYKKMEVNVLPQKPKVDILLKLELDALRENYRKIRNEAGILSMRGIDITKITSLLDEGENALDTAEKMWKATTYDAAKQQIGISLGYLRQAVEELGKIRIISADAFQVVVFISVVAITLMLTIILHLRSSKKKAYAAVRKVLETLKEKRQQGSEFGTEA